MFQMIFQFTLVNYLPIFFFLCFIFYLLYYLRAVFSPVIGRNLTHVVPYSGYRGSKIRLCTIYK